MFVEKFQQYTRKKNHLKVQPKSTSKEIWRELTSKVVKIFLFSLSGQFLRCLFLSHQRIGFLLWRLLNDLFFLLYVVLINEKTFRKLVIKFFRVIFQQQIRNLNCSFWVILEKTNCETKLNVFFVYNALQSRINILHSARI